MATQEHLLTKRARIVRDIAAVRVAAASLSKLLAEDDLVGDAWERAVTVLTRYRAERTRLAKELRTIDSALVQLVTASSVWMSLTNTAPACDGNESHR